MALDIEPTHAHPWIDAAAPTHPSLIDTGHVTGELFGFINIPMAVWIDESGTIVRNAETASIERSPLRDIDVPDGLPEPDDANAHRGEGDPRRLGRVPRRDRRLGAARRASRRTLWARRRWSNGRGPRGAAEAEAAACFELGRYLRATVGEEAAVPWWRRAHELDPGNWTYKRQAWTLVTTPADATENDLIQGPERRLRR